MRPRSRKMERIYRKRRELVAKILDERPACERCFMARSVEVHEVLSRARGGSILDESNCRALCHVCHRFITEHPRQAQAEGFLLSAWEIK